MCFQLVTLQILWNLNFGSDGVMSEKEFLKEVSGTEKEFLKEDNKFRKVPERVPKSTAYDLQNDFL